MGALSIQPVTHRDHDWIAETVSSAFASTRVASRGRLIDTLGLDGYVAHADGYRQGLVLCETRDDEDEVVVLLATRQGAGIGAALLDHAVQSAQDEGRRRIWLITTNDNSLAIRFYRERGFRLAAVHKGAVDEARLRLKPEIPLTNDAGVPIRDEWEFEIILAGR